MNINNKVKKENIFVRKDTFEYYLVHVYIFLQTLLSDINNLTNDGNVWTQEDLFMLESKLLLATEEPLCLDPSPAVVLVANRQQYDRKKLNTPLLKRFELKPYPNYIFTKSSQIHI
jgi:hypothetical protein